MKTRIKIILNYLSKFLLSIVVLGFVLLATLRLTFFNESYMLKQFEKTGYFDQLTEEILNKMSNYIIQSGLEKEVLEDIYTKDMIKEDMHTVITALYHNQSMKIDTSKLKQNLENNVDSYLEKNNIKVDDQEALDRFVDQIADVYESKVNLSGSLNTIQKIVVKIIPFINIGLIITGIAIVALALFVKRYLKEDIITIPFLTTGILILVGCYFFNSKINVNNILIWNEEISSFLTAVLSKLISQLKITAIILMIVAILKTVLSKLFSFHK